MGLIQTGLKAIQDITSSLPDISELAEEGKEALDQAQDVAEADNPQEALQEGKEAVNQGQKAAQKAQENIDEMESGVKQAKSRFENVDLSGFPMDPKQLGQTSPQSGEGASPSQEGTGQSGNVPSLSPQLQEKGVNILQGTPTSEATGTVMVGDVIIRAVQTERLTERLRPQEHPREDSRKFADDAIREPRQIRIEGYFGNVMQPEPVTERQRALDRLEEMKDRAEVITVITDFAPNPEQDYLITEVQAEHVGSRTAAVPGAPFNGPGDAFNLTITVRKEHFAVVQYGASENPAAQSTSPPSRGPRSPQSPGARTVDPSGVGASLGDLSGIDIEKPGEEPKTAPDPMSGGRLDREPQTPNEKDAESEDQGDDGGGFLGGVFDKAKDLYNDAKGVIEDVKNNPLGRMAVNAAKNFAENNIPGASLAMDIASGNVGVDTLVDTAVSSIPGAGAVKSALESPVGQVVAGAVAEKVPFADKALSTLGVDTAGGEAVAGALDSAASAIGLGGDGGSEPQPTVMDESSAMQVFRETRREMGPAARRLFQQGLDVPTTLEAQLGWFSGELFNEMAKDVSTLEDIAQVVGPWMGRRPLPSDRRRS